MRIAWNVCLGATIAAQRGCAWHVLQDNMRTTRTALARVSQMQLRVPRVALQKAKKVVWGALVLDIAAAVLLESGASAAMRDTTVARH